MIKLLSNKLYAQYYPLVTEQDKTNFLNTHYMEMYKKVRDISYNAMGELYAREYNYIKKMKPTVSFLGAPKYKNIAHNEYIIHKMRMDKNIKVIEKEIPNLDSLVEKFVFNEQERITIDELNYILRLMNSEKHTTLIRLLMMVAILCICILIQ